MLLWDPAVAETPLVCLKVADGSGFEPVSATSTGGFTMLGLNALVCTEVMLMAVTWCGGDG